MSERQASHNGASPPQLPLSPTRHLHAPRYHLKAHNPVVVDVLLLQLLFVEVQDEGQMVVQVEL